MRKSQCPQLQRSSFAFADGLYHEKTRWCESTYLFQVFFPGTILLLAALVLAARIRGAVPCPLPLGIASLMQNVSPRVVVSRRSRQKFATAGSGFMSLRSRCGRPLTIWCRTCVSSERADKPGASRALPSALAGRVSM